jgi:hypothetical protein
VKISIIFSSTKDFNQASSIKNQKSIPSLRVKISIIFSSTKDFNQASSIKNQKSIPSLRVKILLRFSSTKDFNQASNIKNQESLWWTQKDYTRQSNRTNRTRLNYARTRCCGVSYNHRILPCYACGET